MNLKVYLILSSAVVIVLALVFVIALSYKPTPVGRGEGYCTQPSDCEGLVHIQCVGGWVCAQNKCGWVCETANVTGGPAPSGGLSGSTVECVEDGNCAPGICPDGYQYQKSACQNYRCYDLQYFADPCMGHY